MPIFSKLVTRFLSMEALMRIEDELVVNPYKGDLIQGTHGARKIRAGADGRGKSGGYRIIYYYHDSKDRIWLLNLYSKKKKERISVDFFIH